MHLSRALLVFSCSPAFAINIILSNDDGWAEVNIRQFYNALTDAGDSVVISAPAENQSGKGRAPTKRNLPCEFNSCPAGSPAIGSNASMPRFNYVNSFPVTAMRTGIQTTSLHFFSDQKPDLALAGPNVGANLGLEVRFSGTVGAATEAVKEGIPGIAFSGATGKQTAWNVDPPPMEASVYADLAKNVTQTLVESGKPYLPANVWLNVNFPKTGGACGEGVGRYKFVLSRIYPAVPLITGKDVVTCGNDARLPTENAVLGTDGCYASISVGHADTKLDATAAEQAVPLVKLGGILSCLPSSSVSVA